MNELEKRYNEIIKERDKIIDRLNVLQRHQLIKEYNNLKAANSDLLREQREINNRLRVQRFNDCNHILVNTYQDWECSYYGCIKCGLHEDVLITFDTTETLMYDYLADQKNYYNFKDSRIIDSSCDLDLGHAIYQKIISSHPDIDDDELIKYFKNALNHMRSETVNQDKTTNRIKRLKLENNLINLKSRD